MVAALLSKFRKEPVFLSALIILLASSVFVRPSIAAIDWKVLVVLFNLMAVIVALEEYQVMNRVTQALVKRFTTIHSLVLCLVNTTGILAMFITNDVALLTMVPLTMLIARSCGFDPVWIIILQTLAANIGSSLTPMGNPQNLFLYEFYHVGNIEFVLTMLPFVLIGLLLVSLMIPIFITNCNLASSREIAAKPANIRRQFFYLLLFVLVIFSVLRFIDYRLMFIITLLLMLLFDPKLLRRVDYYLLGTFVVFFLLVDNLARLPGLTQYLRYLLQLNGHTFLLGVLASQVISNVPAAILLSNFTANGRELLWGVNVGGLGTLIASLASVISYRMYSKEYPVKRYLVDFHLVNIAGVIVFTLGSLLLLF